MANTCANIVGYISKKMLEVNNSQKQSEIFTVIQSNNHNNAVKDSLYSIPGFTLMEFRIYIDTNQ